MLRCGGRTWKRLLKSHLLHHPLFCPPDFSCAKLAHESALSIKAGALQVGTVLEKVKAYSSSEVIAFTDSTGDSNPIHCCPQAAAAALPGSTCCVLPGMMCASLFPAIIGSAFPGAVYLSQTLKFRRPAQVTDLVRARVTVEKKSGSRVTFRTECFSSDGVLLLDGVAVALIASA